MNYSGATRCVFFSYWVLVDSDPLVLQIEYMVVSFDDVEKNAKLSLRQTEILAKLNAIVDDISADCPKR